MTIITSDAQNPVHFDRVDEADPALNRKTAVFGFGASIPVLVTG
ncbi:hypothetical protein Q1M64_20205 [Sinorhizobium meliloti]|nr:hypothetical protein Q1M63_21700 [Sinorhizobium meliloti]WKL42401.1 hypothetical protein Q1M64_20205 [Sinorhizobium meliloti]